MGQREKTALITLLMIAVTSFSLSINGIYNHFTKVAPGHGGTYREGIVGQPRFINPLLANSDTDQALIKLVYSGLYRLDSAGNVIPDLAAALPEITDDGKTYTVKLKPSTWHDGSPVTAEDVIFTVKTLQNPEFNSPRRNDWMATEVTAPDAQTVTFKLNNTSVPFLYNLTLPIISKKVWGTVSPADFVLSQRNIEAIGNGPYIIKEVRKQAQGKVQKITLESFSGYHNKRANIDTLKLSFYDDAESVLNAIHGNLIDGFGFSPLEQNIRLDEANNKLIIKQTPLPQYQAVFLNTRTKLFSDLNVRRALLYATNTQAIIDNVYYGHGKLLNSPILPQHVSGLPDPVNRFDLGKAAGLLDQAGWKVDPATNTRTKNGTALAFTLATNDSNLNTKTAELLATQWQQLNIKVSVNSVPTRELTDNMIKPRTFDALLFAQKLGADPDPFIFWHSSQTKSPGLNLSGYVNNQADKLASEARTEPDEAKRDALYRQFQEVISYDVPAIFIAQNVYTYAIDKMVKGIEFASLPDAPSRFYQLPNWYIQTKRVLK